ncbi:MAG: PRC-barrel domain-containing protein [Clostridiaceae bacterium]|nr:PRC-barrel domain-containing protein [Clostridiaceae bacterium]
MNTKGVIASSENDILQPHQVPEIKKVFLKPIKIIGFHIYDYHGDLIGIIKDTLIQKKTGKIIAFVISEGVFDDLIRGYSILPLVNDINYQGEKITIGDKDIPSILPQGGGLKKLLGID